ncbi:MAG: hypothetical protein CMM50_06645 [Rhodospirillaceae bacterium]|jgi:TPR repeat protein|nr:hypothetical protein [Rhodospirillaceae bacterium]
MKRILLAAGAALVLASPAMADFNSGMKAFKAGEFDVAREEWEQSAIAGDAQAQFQLGKMLANGIGVRKDYITAYAWLFLADAAGIQEAGKYHQVLEKKYLPRYCQYEAQALIRDYRNGKASRLVSDVNRNASKCWGNSPPR